MLIEFLQDAFFAAIAAIGFAAISNPPRRAYLYCALIAAAGHSTRFLLMNESLTGMHIVPATSIAALIVGCSRFCFHLWSVLPQRPVCFLRSCR